MHRSEEPLMDRTFKSRREPPGWGDRIMSRPWGVVFSFFGVWGGLRFIRDGLTEESLSNTIGHWSNAWELILGLTLVLGSVGILWSVLAPPRILSKRWRMEYEGSGLIALSCGYLGYGIGLSLFPGVYGGAAAAITLAVGIAAAMRSAALYTTQRRARAIQTRMEQSGEIDLGGDAGPAGETKGA